MAKKPATKEVHVAGLVSLCHVAVAMAQDGYRVQTAIPLSPVTLPPTYKVKLLRVGAKARAVDPQYIVLETGENLGSVRANA